ncbi:IPT/TIG domain-containing protein [Paenibacillus phocaensis]|uniref:IPT/TIG domain-containing protein n=1 Tax=Paenibacillus phocaensis TaxID=1776378 RepID=UPI000839B741|nr:IPT/TIG domain-containing protein [Paenibacillus phocaensis]
MKKRSGILLFLVFVLMFAQFPGFPTANAATTVENVQVTKTVNPADILEGGETEVTLNVQGTPDSNFVKPNDVILIIDRSGSMASSYGPNNGEDKMKNAREAAKGFIDLVDFSKHRVGIIDFATNVKYKDLSTNPTELKQYVDGIQADGSTYTNLAIEKARQLLSNHRPDAQPVIILMTDGQATDTQKALEQAAIAKNEGIVFYTIALLLKTEDPVTSAPNLLMKDMATTAHHHHFVLGSVGLAEIYAAIVQEIGVASAYDVLVTDSISPEFEIVPDSYKDNIPQPTVNGNTISWKFLELKNELLTFKYKIRHKSGAVVGELPAGSQNIDVQYKNYLGTQHQYTVPQPMINVKHYAPIITSVEKDNGLIQGGEQVVIKGQYFRPNPTVSFESATATSVQFISSNELVVTAPPGVQGNATIKITNDDGQFATANYRYYAFPVISSITPNEGPIEGGTKVVISGNYFMTGAEVLFGGVKATVTKSGATSLEVVSPAGASAIPVDVTVNNPDGTTVTAVNAFTYIKGPEIISIEPNTGIRSGGEQVKLTGERFVDGAKVYFDSTLVNSTFVSSQKITLTTPVWAKADIVDVKVVNPNGQQAMLQDGYTYEDLDPAVTSVTPSSGPMAGGTIVIVKGSNLKSGMQVFWGGQEQTSYTYVSTAEIRLRAPAWPKAEKVSLKIVNPDGKQVELQDVFEYLAPPDPTLSSISPVNGLVSGGTTVTINGANFPSDLKVFFDDQELPVVSQTGAKITVTSPVWSTPEKVDVKIQTSGGLVISLPDAFEYLPLPTPPAPKITSISPSSGSVTGGNIVSINGSNFTNGLKLYFDEKELSYTFVSNSLIRILAPAWASPEYVTVKIVNPDNQMVDLPNGYKYEPIPGPTLTSVTPNVGPVNGGTSVKLTGSNFKNGTKVFFAEQEISATYVTASELRITTPAWSAAETVDVKVVNPDNQSAVIAGGYTFETPPPPPAPVITGLTPNSGPQQGGTTVSIKGSNFTANSVVKFEDTVVAATLLSSSEYRIKTPAWPTAGSVKVSVIAADGQSVTLNDAFTFIAPPEKPNPVVTSVSPNSAELPGSGAIVTVSGQNFESGAVVYFNDMQIAATFLSASQLRIKTPAWSTAESVDVKVVNPDGKFGVLQGGFSYLTPPPPPAPTLNSLSPNSALASTSSVITISGDNFVNGAKVVFGNKEVSSTFLSKTQLRVSSPVWAAPETVTVKVINPDGQSAELVDSFTFRQDPAPTLTSLSPNTGLNTGGGTVTVNGSNFRTGAVVYFDQQAIAATYLSASQLRIKVPAWTAAGAVDVKVTNPDGQDSEVLSGGYVYTSPAPKPAPTVVSVSPKSGSKNGGYVATIYGTNIQSGATVEINGVVVAATYLSSTQLRIKVPASTITGPVTVKIINPDGQSGTLVDGFTYI